MNESKPQQQVKRTASLEDGLVVIDGVGGNVLDLEDLDRSGAPASLGAVSRALHPALLVS